MEKQMLGREQLPAHGGKHQTAKHGTAGRATAAVRGREAHFKEEETEASRGWRTWVLWKGARERG